MQNKENVILTLDDMVECTGGYLSNFKDDININSISMFSKSIKTESLVVASSPKNWKNIKQDSHKNINEMINLGASIVMVDEDWFDQNKGTYQIPFLVVKNTFIALNTLAIKSKEKSKAKRILITGTEGKTSTKYALNYLISQQSSCFAQETSANLTIPILCSLCSIKKSSEFTIIEVSCPQPNRCEERSNIISPDLVVITNLNQSHMNTHGSIQNLLKHKFESLSGLKENGTCVINEDTDLYKEFIELSTKQSKQVQFRTFSALNTNADAYLIEAVYNNLSWDIKARILGETIEYKIDKVQGHWPLTSVGLLLNIALLGLDIKKAASDFKSFHMGWDSMGDIHKIKINGGEFLFYDQHFSITEKALKFALEDVNRIKVKGKKIVVISGELNSSTFATDVHKRIAKYVDNTNIDMLFTVGEHMDITVNELKDTNPFKGHFFNTAQLKNVLLDNIEENDLVFIKGMTKLNFKLLSDSIKKEYKKAEKK